MTDPAQTEPYYRLGAYHRPTDTPSPPAQVWFDRGMVWSYAFNHEEAIRCFERALRRGEVPKLKLSKQSRKEAVKDAGTAVANTVDDAAITAAISAGLAKDPDLSAIKIDVDTKAGAVSLQGPAPSAAAKERAEQVAKGVQGVTSVDNRLEVKG